HQASNGQGARSGERLSGSTPQGRSEARRAPGVGQRRRSVDGDGADPGGRDDAASGRPVLDRLSCRVPLDDRGARQGLDRLSPRSRHPESVQHLPARISQPQPTGGDPPVSSDQPGTPRQDETVTAKPAAKEHGEAGPHPTAPKKPSAGPPTAEPPPAHPAGGEKTTGSKPRRVPSQSAAESARKETNEEPTREQDKESPLSRRRGDRLAIVAGVLLVLAVLQSGLLVALLFGKKDPPLPANSSGATLDEVKDALRNHHGQLARLPDRQKESFLAELRKHRSGGGTIPQPPPDLKPVYDRAGRQLDVMVLALNSRHLLLARYKEAFEGLFELYETEKPIWSPLENYRLGFYVAQTEQVDARVSLETQEIKLISFNIRNPGDDITERLTDIGPAVLGKFITDRPNRRVIIVASSRCPPPDSNAAGWKEIPAVDAVLITPTTGTPPDEARVQAWNAFCQQKRGEAFFLASRSGAGGPDSVTARELRLLLAALVNPYRARK